MTAVAPPRGPGRHTRYRILSRRPDERRFKYLPFTGATGHETLSEAAARIEQAELESPGWSFKIQECTWITESTGWRDVK